MMQGKTHENIKTIRPLKDGVIADFDASEKMISMFIMSIPALKKKMFTPALRMVVCIPSVLPKWKCVRLKNRANA
jgi:rod shape-determining protein MreB